MPKALTLVVFVLYIVLQALAVVFLYFFARARPRGRLRTISHAQHDRLPAAWAKLGERFCFGGMCESFHQFFGG